MITKKDFEEAIDKECGWHLYHERYTQYSSRVAYELAKQMCTEYGQFIMESLGWFHPENPPERNNKNSKELFELYLTENK